MRRQKSKFYWVPGYTLSEFLLPAPGQIKGSAKSDKTWQKKFNGRKFIQAKTACEINLEDYKVDFGEISLHPEECQISAVQKIQQIIVELPPQGKLICKIFKEDD